MPFNLPPVTKALLIANALVFLLQQVLGDMPFVSFMLWPLGSGGDPTMPGVGFGVWQLLSYGFLHGSWPHIIFNMLALAMFGAPLEYTWGPKRYLAYYTVCMVGAGLCQLGVGAWVMAQGGGGYPTIGASGAIFGLMGALISYGRRTGQSYVTGQLWTSAILMFVMSFMMGGHVNNWAHAGGFVGGFLAAQLMPTSHRGEGPGVLLLAGVLALVTVGGFIASFLLFSGAFGG